MKTVFVVDDNDTNLMAAKLALNGSYRTFALPSAEKMFKTLEKIVPDLILLDIEMPETDGFEAIEQLKESRRFARIPVIFLTSRHDAEAEIRGLEVGALDFISKPFVAPVLLKRIKMHIHTDELIKESQRSLRHMQNAIISVVAEMVENRDGVTGKHIERTQMYLEIMLRQMQQQGLYAEQIADWDIELLLASAQLHDVGKIAVSDLILNKPGALTEEEFEIIRRHPLDGERMIDEIIKKTDDDGFLTHARLFAGTHHEKWDGTGYPHGLRGEEIPLQGRLMAIVDVYDALTSERPYKKAFSHERAVEIIRRDGGTHFDPEITKLFLAVADEFAGHMRSRQSEFSDGREEQRYASC